MPEAAKKHCTAWGGLFLTYVVGRLQRPVMLLGGGVGLLVLDVPPADRKGGSELWPGLNWEAIRWER